MADNPPSESAAAPIARSPRPVSEALLNDKIKANGSGLPQWDSAISSFLIRSSLGLSFGVVFSVLLFKRRAWPAWVGLGFGAGRAWEEADGRWRISSSPADRTVTQSLHSVV
ncbi:MAG: hypothetical protein LQ345_002646 [Seirophora villosa]|nr:MAG: hypothetical protein LQ345_002646 [Seirophora villosa]